MTRWKLGSAVVAGMLAAGLAAGSETSLSPEALARIDEAFEKERARYEIPGGALVVVQGGRIAHLRGFGVEDLETRRPVDPQATAFYLASVTKSFTATAVLQLVEQGRLELDRDVNETLRRFEVPKTYPQPITLHHLLTHTAGFEDRSIGYVARSAEDAKPLGDFLALQLPARVFPPGRLASYSNHGYGLAGLLVEEATGRPFWDVLERDLLEPLGMSSSTARTPPPPDFATRVATGYRYDGQRDAMVPAPVGGRNVPPAGSLWATPRDVGRFLLAHLQGGAVDGARILRAETIERMHRRQFSHHPALPGIAYGFYERFRGEHRMLEHAGGVPGWATLLVLIPERGIGIFLATNQSTPAPHAAALEVLLTELFGPGPEAASCGAATPVSAEELGRFAGVYQPTRSSRDSIERIAVLDSQVRVAVADGGRLRVSSRRDEPTFWRPVAPLLFARQDASGCLAFAADDEGRIRWVFGAIGGSGSGFPGAYERSPWLDRGDLQIPYMLGAMAILATAAILVPLGAGALALWRRVRRRPRVAGNRERWPWVWASVAGALAVAFCLGLDGLLGNSAYRLQLAYGMTPEMVALLWLPIAFTALAPVVLFCAVGMWRRSSGSVLGRIFYTLVAATAASFVAFLLHWRLLGFWY